MKHRYIAAAAIIFILLLAVTLFMFLYKPQSSPAPDESALLTETTNYTIQTSIRYENDSSPYHLMDAYLPQGDGSFPAIIYIHGGGWVEGNRSDFNATASLYAQRGIAGFTIDYALSLPNQTAWPQNIQDVIAALKFVRENAAFYHINTEKIALMGASAGAHLASLVGVLSGNETFLSESSTNETVRSQVCLVINYGDVADFQYVGEHWNPSFIYNIVYRAFGNVSYEQNPALWKEASPATYVSADDPPFVFVHGTNDIIVPIQVAESFNSKLQNAGVETHFIRIDGDHDILTNQEWNLQARYSLDPLLKKVFDL